MAQGLLASAGIEALVENQYLSAVDPALRIATSGAKLLVPVGDLEQAEEVLAAAGVAMPRSTAPEESPEIPEEEWSRPSPPLAPEIPVPRGGSRSLALALALVAVLIWLLLRAR